MTEPIASTPEPDDLGGPTERHPLELLNLRSFKHLSDRLQGLVRKRLYLQVLLGMLLGIGTGLVLGPTASLIQPQLSRVIGSWLALPGQVFLALIQMIVVPLVFASIIRGLAATDDMDQLKRTGMRTVAFFLATTTLSIVLGITLAQVVGPGRFVSGLVSAASEVPVEADTELFDQPLPQTLLSLLPTNPLSSMVNLEMLQVVLFAVIVGIAMVSMPVSASRPLLELLGSLQEVCMTVVKWTMRIAPFAVFGLMAQLTAQLGLDALMGMSVYVATVLLGLSLILVVYCLILKLGAAMGPVRFFRDSRELLLLAFSTSSSAAVMPLSIRTAEEKLGVRASISQFVIPLGATINMNGTALYQGVATVFLAQVYGIDLDIAHLSLVVITAVAASVGSPATPGVGIVILAMVLRSAGVPASGIGLLMGVDRILDMSRTAVNVAGDLTASVLLERLAGSSASPAR